MMRRSSAWALAYAGTASMCHAYEAFLIQVLALSAFELAKVQC